MKALLLIFITVIFLATGCISMENTKSSDIPNNNRVIYVPIGDSYTIGQGVFKDEIWPELLTKNLQENGINIQLAENPARSGWTTQQAIDSELPVLEKTNANFSTVLIGANDIVQGIDSVTFRERFSFLLDEMTKIMNNKNIIVMTIPDFSGTPFSKLYFEENTTRNKIEEFNAVIKEEAQKRNLSIADIFEISKDMGSDPSLLAYDKLHPSGKEHKIWEELIHPVAYEILKRT